MVVVAEIARGCGRGRRRWLSGRGRRGLCQSRARGQQRENGEGSEFHVVLHWLARSCLSSQPTSGRAEPFRCSHDGQ